MPPLYDNIADALALTVDGEPHAISLDCQGATFETNEATYGEGWEGVWVKFDLSSAPDALLNITMDMAKTGGGAGFDPYVDIYGVNDASFDPSSPDFQKLTYINNAYFGTGAADPPSQTVQVRGSTGNAPVADLGSQTGIFYAIFTDWNFSAYGSADITYTVQYAICLAATANVHPDSTTTTVVSGRVREDFDPLADAFVDPPHMPTPTLRFSGNDLLPGRYEVRVTGTWTGSPNGGGVTFAFARNGLYLMGDEQEKVQFADTIPFDVLQIGIDANHPPRTDNTNGGLPTIPIVANDEIDMWAWSDLNNGGTFVAVEVSTVCFYKVSAAAPSYQTGEFDTLPLGMPWSDAIADGSQTDFDFCVMPNGDVYAAYVTLTNVGGGAPSIFQHDAIVDKYTAASGSWSTVTSAFNIDGAGSKRPCGGICIETDGTDVYLAWWEYDGTDLGAPTTNYFSGKHFQWHMKKYDVAGSSWTELGTGQAAEGIVNRSNQLDDFWRHAVSLDQDGAIWVANVETLDVASPGNRRRPYLWKWNGAAWSQQSIPAHPGATTWDVTGTGYSSGPRLVAMTIGPLGYPAIHFAFTDSGYTNSESHFLIWDGGAWTVDIHFAVVDVEAAARLNTGSAISIFVAASLLYDGTDILLCADITPDEEHDVLRLSDDQSTFETIAGFTGTILNQPTQGGWESVVGEDGRVHRLTGSVFWAEYYVVALDAVGAEDLGGWVPTGTGLSLAPAGESQVTQVGSRMARIRASAGYLYCAICGDVYTTGGDPNRRGWWIVRGTLVPETFVPHIYRIVHT